MGKLSYFVKKKSIKAIKKKKKFIFYLNRQIFEVRLIKTPKSYEIMKLHFMGEIISLYDLTKVSIKVPNSNFFLHLIFSIIPMLSHVIQQKNFVLNEKMVKFWNTTKLQEQVDAANSTNSPSLYTREQKILTTEEFSIGITIYV